MFDGKLKAVTFSYDDGVTQDKRFIELLDKYNLKCTFNINSGLFGRCGDIEREGEIITHNRFEANEICEVYKNHEIAVHGFLHKKFPELTKEEVIEEVEKDRIELEKLTGQTMYGMAYPFGGKDYIGEISDTVRDCTKMQYARTTVQSFNFEPQIDLTAFRPTIHHNNWDRLFELGKQFVELETDKPQIFYIWGHTYEFDIFNTWDKIEEFFKLISGHDDIFYGTNKEVLLG